MRERRKPHEIILQAIREQYTYDCETGLLYKHGKVAGTPDIRGCLYVCVTTSDPSYLSILCRLHIHQIAWYLHYGEWALIEIDHINGDSADNRISNLRLATHAQNLCNTRKWVTRPTSSQYKGVHWSKQKNKWVSEIIANGKRKYLGSYTNEVEAAQAYDNAARILHGEFARLNFPTTPHQDLPGDVGVGK